MYRVAVILAFWLLFVAEIFVNAAGFPLERQNCSYTIKIKTACTHGAETSDHVSLRFGDSKSNDVLVHHLNSKQVRRVDRHGPGILDDVSREPFQACETNEFQVEGPCVQSAICYLYLKQVGNDGWRPGSASVFMTKTPQLSSKPFYFRRYLPQNVWHGDDVCDTEVTPFGIKHTRKVFASGLH